MYLDSKLEFFGHLQNMFKKLSKANDLLYELQRKFPADP